MNIGLVQAHNLGVLRIMVVFTMNNFVYIGLLPNMLTVHTLPIPRNHAYPLAVLGVCVYTGTRQTSELLCSLPRIITHPLATAAVAQAGLYLSLTNCKGHLILAIPP